MIPDTAGIKRTTEKKIMSNQENKQNGGNTSQKKRSYRFYKKKIAINQLALVAVVVQIIIVRVYREKSTSFICTIVKRESSQNRMRK